MWITSKCNPLTANVKIFNFYVLHKFQSQPLEGVLNNYDYFIIGIDVERPSNSIRRLAEDTLKIALQSPNFELEIEGSCCDRPEDSMEITIATDKGYQEALRSINPIRWELYGPYFEAYAMPFAERNPLVMRDDMVYVVNNQVDFDKDYMNENDKAACVIESYEDLIDIEKYISMRGQMCVYLRTELHLNEDREVWALIGNTDGFKLWCNDEEIISKDEIRLYTPYNNFALLHLKNGKNIILLKLLRRTEHVAFAIGFRQYEGCHWHWSKWCTDLI